MKTETLTDNFYAPIIMAVCSFSASLLIFVKCLNHEQAGFLDKIGIGQQAGKFRQVC